MLNLLRGICTVMYFVVLLNEQQKTETKIKNNNKRTNKQQQQSNNSEPICFFHLDIQDQIFRDPKGGLGQKNAWFAGDVHIGDVNTQTARAVDERLFEHVAPGEKTHLFDLVLDALEQEDYCQFEVSCCGEREHSAAIISDIYISVSLSVSVRLSVCISICLSVLRNFEK